MATYKITRADLKVSDGKTENVDLELNDAAHKSLELEQFSKNNKLSQYRNGFKEDYNQKQIHKQNEISRGHHDKQDYLRMCDQNAQREIRNEEDFKAKFIKFDESQSKRGADFAKNVLVDYSRRRQCKEAITAEKPAYYDKLAYANSKYLEDKQNKLQSAYRFQKSQIDERYKELNKKSLNQTKKGEESYKEFQRFKDDENRLKQDHRSMQSQYADYLKNQMSSKTTQRLVPEEHKPNNIYLGKYKLHRNSSLPMVPGINSSPLKKPSVSKTNFENFRKFKKPSGALHASMEIDYDRGRNGFATSPEEGNMSLKGMYNKMSRNTLRKSGLSTLGSTDQIDDNRYATFDRSNQHLKRGSEKPAGINTNLKGLGINTRSMADLSGARVSNTFKSTFEF